jgi:hypothetical protein
VQSVGHEKTSVGDEAPRHHFNAENRRPSIRFAPDQRTNSNPVTQRQLQMKTPNIPYPGTERAMSASDAMQNAITDCFAILRLFQGHQKDPQQITTVLVYLQKAKELVEELEWPNTEAEPPWPTAKAASPRAPHTPQPPSPLQPE